MSDRVRGPADTRCVRADTLAVAFLVTLRPTSRDAAAMGAPGTSSRFEQALAEAASRHRTQLRKGTSVPYVSHVLMAAAFAMEDGADDDQAVAALLHDSVEDTGLTLDELRATYGDRVAEIVEACSDDMGGDPEHKAPWWPRKVAHIAALASCTDVGVFRVAAADKAANLHSLLATRVTESFAKFKGGLGGTYWYHSELGRVLIDGLPADSLLATHLERSLADLREWMEHERHRHQPGVASLATALAGTPVPGGSVGHDPWPWFALDAVHRGGGVVRPDVVTECWHRWFGPDHEAVLAAALDGLR